VTPRQPLSSLNRSVRLAYRFVFWAIVLAALCNVLWALAADAAELTREQAASASAYLLAHSTSHYPLPPAAPEIHLVPIQHLRDRVCPGHSCAVHGLQVENRIYLDEALDMSNLVHASILYHELVHYLQWSARGDAKDCQEYLEREVEAYGLQIAVLAKAGIAMRLPHLPACS